jgi:hypothetical protein
MDSYSLKAATVLMEEIFKEGHTGHNWENRGT